MGSSPTFIVPSPNSFHMRNKGTKYIPRTTRLVLPKSTKALKDKTNSQSRRGEERNDTLRCEDDDISVTSGGSGDGKNSFLKKLLLCEKVFNGPAPAEPPGTETEPSLKKLILLEQYGLSPGPAGTKSETQSQWMEPTAIDSEPRVRIHSKSGETTKRSKPKSAVEKSKDGPSRKSSPTKRLVRSPPLPPANNARKDVVRKNTVSKGSENATRATTTVEGKSAQPVKNVKRSPVKPGTRATAKVASRTNTAVIPDFTKDNKKHQAATRPQRPSKAVAATEAQSGALPTVKVSEVIQETNKPENIADKMKLSSSVLLRDEVEQHPNLPAPTDSERSGKQEDTAEARNNSTLAPLTTFEIAGEGSRTVDTSDVTIDRTGPQMERIKPMANGLKSIQEDEQTELLRSSDKENKLNESSSYTNPASQMATSTTLPKAAPDGGGVAARIALFSNPNQPGKRLNTSASVHIRKLAVPDLPDGSKASRDEQTQKEVEALRMMKKVGEGSVALIKNRVQGVIAG